MSTTNIKLTSKGASPSKENEMQESAGKHDFIIGTGGGMTILVTCPPTCAITHSDVMKVAMNIHRILLKIICCHNFPHNFCHILKCHNTSFQVNLLFVTVNFYCHLPQTFCDQDDHSQKRVRPSSNFPLLILSYKT